MLQYLRYDGAMLDADATTEAEPLKFVREHLIDADLADGVATIFWALSDPTRVRIIHALTLAELCNGDLASILGITESAVSHQMHDLRLMKLVSAQKRGRQVYYTLSDPHIRHVFEDTLRHVQEPDRGA
jgi:DNA-binding transcriptional ArsR family regulator